MSVQLAYSEQGDGFPLLLLHGNGESRHIYQEHMARFSAIRRVIAMDTRGHGQSPRGNASFTLRQFAVDLEHFMDTHQIQQADILGFSDGGNIALLFALAHPKRVRRLIINGANLFPTGMKLSALLLIDVLYTRYWVTAPFSQRARDKRDLFSLMACEPHIRPQQLSSLTMPVLVLAGTNDLIREKHTRHIASMLPQSQLCLLRGGHMLVTEQPEAFSRAVVAFLLEGGVV